MAIAPAPYPQNSFELAQNLKNLHELIQRWNSTEAQISQVRQAHRSQYKKVQPKVKGFKKIFWISVALIIVAMIAENFAPVLLLPFYMIASVIPVPTWILFPAVNILLWNFVVVPYINKRKRTENNKISQEMNQDLVPYQANYQAALADVSSYISNGWYPAAECYSEAVAYCHHAVSTQRASTIGEALRLFDENVRHNQNIAIQKQQLIEQQRTTQAVQVGNQIAQMGNIINAAGHANTAATIRNEGAATRAAMNRPQQVNHTHNHHWHG